MARRARRHHLLPALSVGALARAKSAHGAMSTSALEALAPTGAGFALGAEEGAGAGGSGIVTGLRREKPLDSKPGAAAAAAGKQLSRGQKGGSHSVCSYFMQLKIPVSGQNADGPCQYLHHSAPSSSASAVHYSSCFVPLCEPNCLSQDNPSDTSRIGDKRGQKQSQHHHQRLRRPTYPPFGVPLFRYSTTM